MSPMAIAACGIGGKETSAEVAVFIGQILCAKSISQRRDLAIPVLHGNRHALAVKEWLHGIHTIRMSQLPSSASP